jgi:lipopolysaccharide biosynthesis protein
MLSYTGLYLKYNKITEGDNILVFFCYVKTTTLAILRRFFLSSTFFLTPIKLTKFLYSSSLMDNDYGIMKSESELSLDLHQVGRRRKRGKVALILHIFYADIGLEILSQIFPHHHRFDKIMITHSISPDLLIRFQKSIPLELFVKCEFVRVRNQYSDCTPFIEAAQSEYLSDCTVFLKLHTKRSPHLPNNEGETWRRNLIEELLNIVVIDHLISQLLESTSPLWMCPDHWISDRSKWGFNSFQVWKITNSIGVPFRGPQPFPVGNMYWLNRGVLDFFLIISREVKIKPSKVSKYLKDGTINHALERVVGSMPFNSF